MAEQNELEILEITDEKELDAVFGGAITAHHINGGGNEPGGNANGVPVVNLNPAGSAPPGQN